MEKVDHFSQNSFPKNLRILKSDHFKKVFKSGKRLHSENFTLYLLHNNLDFPRLGISVGRKVSSKAIERNRIKRKLRETFRTNKTIFDKNDIVIVVKKNISDVELNKIYLEIKKTLRN